MIFDTSKNTYKKQRKKENSLENLGNKNLLDIVFTRDKCLIMG